MHSNENTNTSALTVDEARSAILSSIERTTLIETIQITAAVGRTIAAEQVAKIAIPPFRNSAMDGYAIRSKDAVADQTFKIIGKSLAGHPFNGTIKAGEAVRITTGAPIPEGADAIVIQELVNVDRGTFTTTASISAQQYIRNPGDDIQSGQLLCATGSRLTTADIGLLAAQGVSHIDVFATPKVGVFSTGDELLTATEELTHGRIFDSNRATICTMLKNAGIESIDLGICKDDRQSIDNVMQSASGFDFVLSSGGVSVGEADYVKDALEANGDLLFWKVAMKPGKPLVTGKLADGSYYFGLPGNPVSSMVTCLQFVIPAIHAFSGVKYSAPPVIQARSLDSLKKESGRFEFQRGIASIAENNELTVSTTGLQDSHVLSSMSKANCFICLDQFADGAGIDEMVNIVFFSAINGL